MYVPLGGTGEIGMNLNMYGTDGQWLMIDCGMMMDRGASTDEVIVPDASFAVAHKDDLAGIVLTHAHMDHIGALSWIWPSLQCPIYATPYTAAVVLRELSSQLPPLLLQHLPIITVSSAKPINIGPFEVEWVNLTHSIPEPNAIILRSAAGTVFHTGDWKIDPHPVLGDTIDERYLRRIGQQGVNALIGDSTNSTRVGSSGSESSLIEPLKNLCATTTGRVVVSCFASNVARLCTLGRVAEATGRRLCLLGVGLEKTVSTARQLGLWPQDLPWVPAQHVGYLPREEVLAVATGSQGENRAALARLAAGYHRDLELEAGDRVIFSARRIPGNEALIERMIERFRARDIEVIEDGEKTTHVSGHPHRDELAQMYGWLKPRAVIPTHGEPEHLQANARVAKESGVPVTLDARNGDVCVISGGPTGIVGQIPSGRVRIDRRYTVPSTDRSLEIKS